MKNTAMLSLAALFAGALVCAPKDPSLSDRYNPATAVEVRGVVTDVRVVPAGSPLAGVHVTLKTKTENVEVFLAPREFLVLLKSTVAVGDDLRIFGSRVNGIILTREFFKKGESIVLREKDGEPVWENWGVSIDSSIITG